MTASAAAANCMVCINGQQSCSSWGNGTTAFEDLASAPWNTEGGRRGVVPAVEFNLIYCFFDSCTVVLYLYTVAYPFLQFVCWTCIFIQLLIQLLQSLFGVAVVVKWRCCELNFNSAICEAFGSHAKKTLVCVDHSNAVNATKC